MDDVGNFINTAVNNNAETPINFISEYDSGVLTLTATRAGNTNPWTIVFNNNGATAANAGNLSTSSVQTGEIINQVGRFGTSILSCDIIQSANATNQSFAPPTISLATNTSISEWYIGYGELNSVFSPTNYQIGSQSGVGGQTTYLRGGDVIITSTTADIALTATNDINLTATNATLNSEAIATQETGTWTPTFTNGGTEGTIIARYTKTGNTVTLYCVAEVAASTSTGAFFVNVASMPYAPETGTISQPVGNFLIDGTILGISLLSKSTGILFYDNTANVVIGTAIGGNTTFTITYETS